MQVPFSIGRRGLVSFWLASSFVIASYYNACGNVTFDQSSEAKLATMQSTAQIRINKGDLFTNSDLVDVELESMQSDEVYITNDPTCAAGGQWEPITAHHDWTLGKKNDETSVFAKFRNSLESIETSCVTDSIVHDDIAPDVVLSSASSATKVDVPVVTYVASDAVSGLDKQFCQWPGKAAADCNFSTSDGKLAEGRYMVKVSASDKAGNVSVPVVHDLTVDRTPPVITIMTSPPTLGSSTAANFTFNVTDNLSGVKSMECSWENDTSYAACTSPLAKNLAEGAHKVFIRAHDVAGNEAVQINAFKIDLTAPTVTITSGPPDFASVKTADFAFTGTDNGTAITQFECRLDNGAYASCATPKNYAGLSEGTHTFYVRGYDNAGNVSAPATRTWYVDVTPPLVNFVMTPPGLSKNTTADFKYNVSDGAGSGIAKTQCNFDAGGFKDCPADAMSYAALGAGDHTMQVRATDKAGNVGDSSLYKFTIDLKPPSLMFTDTPTPVSKLTQYQFKFVANDENGVDHVDCRLDAAAYMKCDSVGTHLVSGLTDGKHTFTIRATDKAGNQSAEVSYTWTVDTTPPTIIYLQPPPASVLANVPVMVTFTAADAGGSGVMTVTCTLDGNAVACQSGVMLTLPAMAAGTHTLVVTAVDSAGNTAMDTKSIMVSAPTLHTQQVDVKTNAKVDVLVIMDNSGSMAGEMNSMAQKVSTFVQQLAGLDWQIGIITTDVAADAPLKDGRLVELKNMPGQYILTSAMDPAVASNTFSQTVVMQTNGSGNEQGFAASMRAMDRAMQPGVAVNAPNVALIRPDAPLAVIVVSDAYDSSGKTPEDVTAKVKGYWPAKAFVWHSIVVPASGFTDPNGTKVNPNDPCANYRESVQYDGREYHRLSALTGGIQGNECTTDYGSQLKDMGKVTSDLVKSLALDCNPVDYNNDGKVDAADVMVTDGKGVPITDFTVMGNKLTFAAALPIGVNSVKYYCVP